MASNKIFNSQPAYIATAALSTLGFNLFNCSITSLTPQGIGYAATQPYALMKHVRVQNQLTTSAINVTLYKGPTLSSVAGQEFALASVSIPAQSYVDWYGQARFDATDFLTGSCNLPQAAIINMEGEVGLS